MNVDKINFLNLGFSDFEKELFNKNRVENLRQINRIKSDIQKEAKLPYCYLCKNEVSSFCNSHSVPKFCLKQIAVNGYVYYANTLIGIPLLKDDKGVNEAGTFRLICQNCDNTSFQQYENPSAYEAKPSQQILGQIAMKNYLKLISEKRQDKIQYKKLKEKYSLFEDFIDINKEAVLLDLIEFEQAFERAKLAAHKSHDNWYYICYYEVLDYTVPIAFQSAVTLISDLDDNVINDIYNDSKDYHTQDIHISIFPLNGKSIVMMFVDSRVKRYRKFYKQLHKLPMVEQLSVINYIIFSYSDNVYMSPQIDKDILKNSELIAASQKSNIALTTSASANVFDEAINIFSLSKHKDLPNLLSEEYKIDV